MGRCVKIVLIVILFILGAMLPRIRVNGDSSDNSKTFWCNTCVKNTTVAVAGEPCSGPTVTGTWKTTITGSFCVKRSWLHFTLFCTGTPVTCDCVSPVGFVETPIVGYSCK